MDIKNDPIQKILDPNNNDNVVLYNGNDEPVEFEQIFIMPLNGKDYTILRPVVTLEGMSEDEAIVFEIIENDGELSLNIEQDDSVIDAVFDVYNRMFEESKKNNK